ncbi:MAG: S1C family serine protease [Ktedonobacterales bacterium]
MQTHPMVMAIGVTTMSAIASLVSLPELSEELSALGARLRASTVQIQVHGRGIGSGIIWQVEDDNGSQAVTVITNAHVVRATGGVPLTVRLSDGREVAAVVLAVDPRHDLAALSITAGGVTAAEIGDSAALRVGEVVVAVGNPFGREGAVSLGVVAARAPADPDAELDPVESQTSDEDAPRGWMRRALDLIQADLRLYPGNSGGPLADAAGRVVGVNAMISGGLAFAIPSRTVQEFLAQSDQSGRRTHLGIEVLTVPLAEGQRARLGMAQPAAVLVAGIEPGGAADRAGVLVGDLLAAVDGKPVRDAEQLLRRLAAHTPETSLGLTLLRGGTRLELNVPAVAETRAA